MFPPDTYTPFGYLANPAAFARSWGEGEGGALRSTDDRAGFGWWYPFHQRARAGCTLELGLELDGRRVTSRADWAALGLYSARHGARLLSYDAAQAEVAVSAAYFLAHDDGLVCVVTLRNRGTTEHEVLLSFSARSWHDDGSPVQVSLRRDGADFPSTQLAPGHALVVGTAPAEVGLPEPGAATVDFPVRLSPGSTRTVAAALGRGPDAREGAVRALADWPGALERARADDDAFWAGAARLEGDWPPSWRRGWVYDLETARLCLSQPGGIYHDVWPAWSANWPRSVLAEGTLDMLRLALAAPDLARRAVLSLFRDAPRPNIPCVFKHGEPNMVAADGQSCGTSPAWCLPFHNLYLLERLAPDREWQRALYPHLSAYLRWWLENRTGASGWASYHCTWESGEDGTPRLDASRRGEGAIDGQTWPVELQASIAQGAGVLQRWAEELDLSVDAEFWSAVRRRYIRLARALWHAPQQRFRDRDERGDVLTPCGSPPYWGGDPCQDSVLALTVGLGRVATRAQRRHLALQELPRYLGSPWCEWPSWCWTVAEVANSLGRRDLASALTTSVLARVYPENDRRASAPDGGPLPGVAREWWPVTLAERDAGEAYSWGGTTALLFLRHIFGVLEDFGMRQRPRLRLAPALPAELLVEGRHYAVANLPYAGQHLDITYVVQREALAARVHVRESGLTRRLSLPNFAERWLAIE